MNKFDQFLTVHQQKDNILLGVNVSNARGHPAMALTAQYTVYYPI